MAKLGKKARKFAKKHLQSTLKKRRQTKALFKKRYSKSGKNDTQEQVDNPIGLPNRRAVELDRVGSTDLDFVFADNYKDDVVDASDSDGYLSEGSSITYDVDEDGEDNAPQDVTSMSTYSAHNEEIRAKLAVQEKKLDRLRKEDPEFSDFLKSHENRGEKLQSEDAEYSDEADSGDEGGEDDYKLLSNRVINKWCQLVKEEHSQSALTCLLNAYRAACHYGAESISHKIESDATYCNILIFVLSNANDIFRGLLDISSLDFSKETLQEIKKNPNWESSKQLVKSYVRSTLFLLNQVTDTDILTLAMMRVRFSLILFVAFPSLMPRLIKATVHLWATGGTVLSLASFHILRDVTSKFSSSYYDNCLSKAFIAFVSVSRVTEITDIKHIHFLRDCIVELCSQNMQKSSQKAVASMSQLAKILKLGKQTKTKEAVKKVCSWEFVSCVDLWVKFISSNTSAYDLQHLFFMTVELAIGMANMFPAPRYFPLRVRCIAWLNCLAGSHGKFIPLSSLLLGILEYKIVKAGKKAKNAVNFASTLKIPKQYLKSSNFQEECIQSVVEQFSLHFSQWSYNISFPELASILLVNLKKFHETATTTESLRRIVKRMIDQVEQNVEFVRKKRDDASFSPLDLQAMDSFLQHEKSTLSTPFSQYYKSVLANAAERSSRVVGKMSLKRNREALKEKTAATNLKTDANQAVVEMQGLSVSKRSRKAIEVE